jgi:retinol dehydrogenase-12
LKAATGYTKAELWIIDLADFASVKQFADRFEQDGGRLDILVENAAIAPTTYEATKDGWESSFVSRRLSSPTPRLTDDRLQVNDLSTSLLALLLLPIMIKTAKEHATLPRLVVVSSGVHYWITIEKDLCESPTMLKTFGSSEYCTPKYALRPVPDDGCSDISPESWGRDIYSQSVCLLEVGI